MMLGLGQSTPAPVGSTCPSGYSFIPGVTLPPPGISTPGICSPDEDVTTDEPLSTVATPVTLPMIPAATPVTAGTATVATCPAPADPTYGAVCPSGFELVTLTAPAGNACGTYQCENSLGQSAAEVAASNSVSAGAAPSVAPASASPCSIALFGDTSCFTFGSTSIGQTTLYAGLAVIAALFFFGGRKR